MRPLLAAIQFLTFCPVPSRFHCGERELNRSVIFFPIVGLILGAGLAFLDQGLSRLLAPLPAGAVIVAFMAAASRFLHMDGLADTADGLLSLRPKECILEIMRDSRTGPMGVIAVVWAVVLKVAALASVPEPLRWGVVLMMPLAGRCALVIQMAVLAYARSGGGLVSAFGRPGRLTFLTALLVLTATAWLALRSVGLAAAGASVIAALFFSLWCRRRIGGFTGDTLGAACEIAELVPALVAAVRRWPQ